MVSSDARSVSICPPLLEVDISPAVSSRSTSPRTSRFSPARSPLATTILATPPADFKSASPDEQERVLKILRNIEPISAREKKMKVQAYERTNRPRKHDCLRGLVAGFTAGRRGCF